jgi:hypothetical protein
MVRPFFAGEQVFPEVAKNLALTKPWKAPEAAALQAGPYLGPTGASFPARFRDAQCPPQTA